MMSPLATLFFLAVLALFCIYLLKHFDLSDVINKIQKDGVRPELGGVWYGVIAVLLTLTVAFDWYPSYLAFSGVAPLVPGLVIFGSLLPFIGWIVSMTGTLIELAFIGNNRLQSIPIQILVYIALLFDTVTDYPTAFLLAEAATPALGFLGLPPDIILGTSTGMALIVNSLVIEIMLFAALAMAFPKKGKAATQAATNTNRG